MSLQLKHLCTIFAWRDKHSAATKIPGSAERAGPKKLVVWTEGFHLYSLTETPFADAAQAGKCKAVCRDQQMLSHGHSQ